MESNYPVEYVTKPTCYAVCLMSRVHENGHCFLLSCKCSPSVKSQDINPNPDETPHTKLIAFVHDRCKENDWLIAEINKRKAVAGVTVERKQLRVRCLVADETFRFPVREHTETVDVNTFASEWCPVDTTYIDTRADWPFPINWHLDSFDKLVQTNGDACNMATLLAIAGDSLQSKQVVVKLLRNVMKMGDQLRQLFVLACDVASAAAVEDAVDDAATRCKVLQDELESAVQSVLRKHGAVAEANTGMSAIPTAASASATAVPTIIASLMPSSAVQAAMSTMGVLAEHRASLLQWISEARGAPYTGDTLTLQYQASRDGWKGNDFRRMCNGQGSMLFIVRSDRGYLFGGYTSVGFTQHTDDDYVYARDDAAFVFTLTNPHGIAPSKYRCKKPNQALVNWCSGHERGLNFYQGFNLASDCNMKAESWVDLDAGYFDTPYEEETFTGSHTGWTVSEVLGIRV